MAPLTIFQQSATDRGGATSDTSAYTLGIEVEVSATVPFTGIWFYSPSDATILPSETALYDIDTETIVPETLDASPSWSGAAGSGWVKASYNGSVSMTPGVHYAGVVYGAGGSPWYLDAETNGLWTTGIGEHGLSDGILSAPSSVSAVNGQALLHAGSGMAFPGTSVSGYDFGVDVEVTPAGSPSVITTSLSAAAENVAYMATLAATGGTPAYTWSVLSGSLPAGLSLNASTGVISGTPTALGASSFTVEVTDQASETATQALSIAVDSLVVTLTGASGGISTYTVLSALNNTGAAGPSTMRVLTPSSPTDAAACVLWALPVEANQGTTYGDPIGAIEALGAQDTYNATVIELGFPVNPWYANNPDDATTQQEAFVLAMVAWVKANLAAGSGKHYLIGFSKSGFGGSGLLFRNPAVFMAGAFWDFPAMMTHYDGTDPDYSGSPVGGGTEAVYGTDASFAANYELSSGNLTAWKAASTFGLVNRIWLGGYNTFPEVSDYDALLTSLGILHTYASVSASIHNWAPSPGWLGPALAAIMPAAGAAPAALNPLCLGGSVIGENMTDYSGEGFGGSVT